MRLVTIENGLPDGRLHFVSRDMKRIMPTKGTETMQLLLETWQQVAPGLEMEYEEFDIVGGEPFDNEKAMAPLPRAWQWLDGSAYESHSELMQKVFKLDPVPPGRPLMYQGLSDHFLSATADVPLPSEEDGIDFEGEFGVICDHVPMGTTAGDAQGHIRLVAQINDWSLRTIAPIEMKTGFGWIQAKPACSMAPVAITPDELGPSWKDCRVDLPLLVELNGARFGNAEGYPMAYGFDELIAHAARTRELVAGTIIGSGTVSNANYREVGSSCIAERRGIEILDHGEPKTPYMKFGDQIRMECVARDGSPLFGAINQKVIIA